MLANFNVERKLFAPFMGEFLSCHAPFMSEKPSLTETSVLKTSVSNRKTEESAAILVVAYMPISSDGW